jgi:pre-mRNA-splicing factor SYF1
LDPSQLREIGLSFAEMERKLGEIDRARAIYMHLSQFCNPSAEIMRERFWSVWDQFENNHGSEDTYKDFLKIQKSVAIKYSTVAPQE